MEKLEPWYIAGGNIKHQSTHHPDQDQEHSLIPWQTTVCSFPSSSLAFLPITGTMVPNFGLSCTCFLFLSFEIYISEYMLKNLLFSFTCLLSKNGIFNIMHHISRIKEKTHGIFFVDRKIIWQTLTSFSNKNPQQRVEGNFLNLIKSFMGKKKPHTHR